MEVGEQGAEPNGAEIREGMRHVRHRGHVLARVACASIQAPSSPPS